MRHWAQTRGGWFGSYPQSERGPSPLIQVGTDKNAAVESPRPFSQRESPLLAQSGQSDRTRVCPLLDQSGQRWILACNGLPANDPKRTCHAAYMSRLLEELGIEVIF